MAKTTTERLYVIPLKDAWKGAYKRRAKKAVAVIKAFASRHMKKDIQDIKVGSKLNEHIWSCGIKHPPVSVKVRTFENEGKIWVELQGEKIAFELAAEKKKKEEAKPKQKAVKAEEAKKEEAKETPGAKEEKPWAEAEEESKTKEEPKKEEKPEEAPKAKETNKEEKPKPTETKETPKKAAIETKTTPRKKD